MERNLETEQLKDFYNRVEINGKLASIEVFNGKTGAGIPYISIKGEIQYGDTGVETADFKSFAVAQKKDGSPSKLYTSLKDFADKAVPMTKDKANATMLLATGRLDANDFYSERDGGKVIEGVQNTISFFGDYNPTYTERDGYLTNVTATVDGYVLNISDEIKNDEPTGRKKFNLLTLDPFKNAVIIKNIMVEATIAEDFVQAYDKGDTAQFFLTRMVHKGESHALGNSSGGVGFGTQRVTEGRDYTEWICTGGTPIYEEDSKKVITPKMFKELMTVRENKLSEIKAAGESGGQKQTSERTSFKAKTTTEEFAPISDDDIPF